MPFSKVYRATVFAKRKDGVSQEEFSRRFARHGTLAGPVIKKHNGIAYVQHHVSDAYAEEFKEKIGPEMVPFFNFTQADGINTLIFPTMDDLVGFFKDPAHEETLNADVAEFADPTSVTFAVGDENVVIEDGKLLV
ncbi:hypothetical protein CEP54_004027 [Fusarium duplospermum]|uniref:EthD domain-containing protein n=1 Tax=Fusarium duplospermum TaxID=1325734 RepID=A0A428QKT6_9HYPO|nr:hypothetical protein CEP54_004027 [Fusarium duplospermum]